MVKMYSLEECQKAYDYYKNYVKKYPKSVTRGPVTGEIKTWIVNCAVGYIHPRSNSAFDELSDFANHMYKEDKDDAAILLYQAAGFAMTNTADEYLTLLGGFVRLLES